jgi:hypothetical protein
MPIKHLTFFALAVFMLVSCKKNSGTNASGNANKLKTYIETDLVNGANLSDTFSVTYDNDNRLIGLVSSTLKYVYTYQSKSYTLDIYYNGAVSTHATFYINGSSLVDSTLQFGTTNDTTTEGFVYNGAQLTTLFTYDYVNNTASIDTRDDYTYDNSGNVLKDVQSDGYGNVNQVNSYTYTTSPVNATINPTYFPQQSKYLPATLKVTDGFGNSQGSVTYAYVFDGSNRLTKETDTDNSGNISTKTYIYE